MSPVKILEIACFNLPSALISQVSGADRIELCENYHEGGLTPSYKLIQETRQKIQIPLHVIIRPRAGDFCYSEEELKVMENDVLFCKAHQVEGIVFGVLGKDNEINTAACQRMIALARPMSVTFHRAIDACGNQEASLNLLAELGVDRVLTSGGKGNAEHHVAGLKKLQNLFGSRIILMPGGGIRSSNLKEIMKSHCSEFHSSALTGNSEVADAEEIRSLKQLLSVQHNL